MGNDGPRLLFVKVVPMGYKHAVAICQHLVRSMVLGGRPRPSLSDGPREQDDEQDRPDEYQACGSVLPLGAEIRSDKILPGRASSIQDPFWQQYIDNWDSRRLVAID